MHSTTGFRPLALTALPPRAAFVRRLARSIGLTAGLISGSLGIGALGYHAFVGLDWLDATLNASMILTGMGPIAALVSPAAKLFGIFYTLFSGIAFLTCSAVLIGPVAQRFLHRLHLDIHDASPDR